MSIVELHQDEVMYVSGGGWFKEFMGYVGNGVGSVLAAGYLLSMPEIAEGTAKVFSVKVVGSAFYYIDYGVRTFSALCVSRKHMAAAASIFLIAGLAVPFAGGIIEGVFGIDE